MGILTYPDRIAPARRPRMDPLAGYGIRADVGVVAAEGAAGLDQPWVWSDVYGIAAVAGERRGGQPRPPE